MAAAEPPRQRALARLRLDVAYRGPAAPADPVAHRYTRAAVLLVAYDVAVLVALEVALVLLVGGAGLLVVLDPFVVLALSMGRDPADAVALLVVALGGLALVDVRVDAGGLQVAVTRSCCFASA